MESPKITIEDVLKLDKPTDSFLCLLSDNIYNIKFRGFKIRDLDSGLVLFEVENDYTTPEELKSDEDEDWRTVKYHFGPNFFKLKHVGTTLRFSVGPKPAKNFRMIERHYFKNKLIKTFDFVFPFCIPNSTNEWENMYTLPEFTKELIDDMIKSPWETKSDSFYFVEDLLIMHNKAEYSYAPYDDEYTE